jgi:type IV pilus assembly protein PilY1
MAAAAGNGWTSTTCSNLTTGPTLVPSCTADPASPSNSYTATTCVSAGSKKLTYQLIKTITTSQVSGGIVVSSSTPVVTAGATVDLDGICYPTNIPLLPALNPAPAGNGNPGPNPPSGCSKWPCITTTNNSGGSVNSLADVAQYYYVTDLRPTMVDNVPNVGSGPEDDRLHTQHMTTFTIGLGVSGTLTYRADYRSASATTGDFADIRTGAKSWPLWPDPSLDPLDYNNWNNPRSIDDFWHTAVNGRGQYFSAGNPASVVSGISGALSGIAARLSSGAAAGASNLQPVAGDNFAFTASYKTGDWTGDVVANAYDLTTAAVSATTAWPKSASDSLDTTTKAACDNRNIFLIRPGATNNLVKFTWNTQTCDPTTGAPSGGSDTSLNTTEMANFGSAQISLLSQRPTMTDGSAGTVDQVSAAAGANMVNFLRGQTGFVGFEAGSATKLYRDRAHVLGDIIGGQPVYVKGPSATYADSGYGAFMTGPAASRPKMVYVAANDGMLHAFHAGVDATDTQGGQEAWAIIPSAVLPNLYKLADDNYKNVHQYYVDGTPLVADVRNGASGPWRSMLVGGLNDGGKGYYAIDITDPTAPQAMWEFKYVVNAVAGAGSAASAGDNDLGLTFGKPVVTKIKDSLFPEGRWVVLLTSGYNNSATGNGHGYLYVLDANTGAVLQKIDTGAGTAASPANLGQINVYVDDGRVNNLAVHAYGADMLGNVWSFDVNTGTFAGASTLVGQAKDSNGNPQPITTRPELAELNGKPMIFVGTGRLLGTSDMTDTSTQSIYGIVDPLTGNPEYSDLRAALKPMVMTVQGAGNTAARTIACSTAPADAARCASTKGWVIDLPDTGERVNVDPQLVLTTLVVGSNVPTGDVCSSGGHSWLNFIDFATGNSNGSFGGAGGDPSFVSMYLTNSLIVGVNIVQLPNKTIWVNSRTTAPGDVGTQATPPPPPPSAKRISWREIPQ